MGLYRKSTIKPQEGGGLSNFGHSRRRLNREEAFWRGEAYSQNQMTRTEMIASHFSIPYFVDSTDNFTCQIHEFNTVLSQSVTLAPGGGE